MPASLIPNDTALQGFCALFQTKERTEKYKLIKIEKFGLTKTKERDFLVPMIYIYTSDRLSFEEKGALQNELFSAYSAFFEGYPRPGTLIKNSGEFLRKLDGRCYHLCAVDNPIKPDFSDFEIYSVSEESFDIILKKRYPLYKCELDEKIIARIKSTDESMREIYLELFRNGLTETALKAILKY